MEPRTAHVEHETETKTTVKPRTRTRSPESNWKRQGRSLLRRVSEPVLSAWDQYLRVPVSTGLITTGALLTESGRLIRNSRPKRRIKKTAGTEPAEKKAEEKILH